MSRAAHDIINVCFNGPELQPVREWFIANWGNMPNDMLVMTGGEVFKHTSSEFIEACIQECLQALNAANYKPSEVRKVEPTTPKNKSEIRHITDEEINELVESARVTEQDIKDYNKSKSTSILLDRFAQYMINNRHALLYSKVYKHAHSQHYYIPYDETVKTKITLLGLVDEWAPDLPTHIQRQIIDKYYAKHRQTTLINPRHMYLRTNCIVLYNPNSSSDSIFTTIPLTESPRYYFTYKPTIAFTESTDHPNFTKWLNDVSMRNGILDKKMPEIILQIMALCVYGNYLNLPNYAICQGDGGSGKSSTAYIIRQLLAPQLCSKIGLSKLLTPEDNRFHMSKLENRYCNLSEEVHLAEGKSANFSQINELTGNFGDGIIIEDKFEDPRMIYPYAFCANFANKIPYFNPGNEFWRRIVLCHFGNKFKNDSRYLDILKPELPAIFTHLGYVMKKIHDNNGLYVDYTEAEKQDIFYTMIREDDIYTAIRYLYEPYEGSFDTLLTTPELLAQVKRYLAQERSYSEYQLGKITASKLGRHAYINKLRDKKGGERRYRLKLKSDLDSDYYNTTEPIQQTF